VTEITIKNPLILFLIILLW